MNTMVNATKELIEPLNAFVQFVTVAQRHKPFVEVMERRMLLTVI